ncbi:MAG: hypothetical protein SGJ13_15575 [Actinomycetota bacterium]|nr:hypothetical protein [Actinomycetota bacterium]
MLDRRSFLGLAGGVVILAACGGGGDDDAADSTFEHDHPFDGLTELRPGVLSSDLYVSDTPQRFAFAMTAKEGYASMGAVRVAAAPEGRKAADFVETTLHTDGLPERRGVYVAEMTLATAGIWDAVVDLDGETVPFAFQVKAQAEAPTIGSAAPTNPSPTPDATLGVDPICTRNPMCELHASSLDTAIGAGTPVVALFATPARCTSEYCGPVLDTMLPLVKEYDGITFVHIEIYKDLRSEDLVPTVVDWGLPSEPFLFGIAADGTITARLDGAFGQDEMRAVFDDLVS